MDAKTIEWIIGGPLILGLLFVTWLAAEESEKRLNDPDDDRTLFLNDLPAKTLLFPQGVYRVSIIRQSGNLHAEHIVEGTAAEAVATVMRTFGRAKIEAVHVRENTDAQLDIGRLFHDHRGRGEGKKVGRATITVMRRAERPMLPASAFKIDPISMTCDCGNRAEVPFEHINEPRTCPACGKDASLTRDQLAQLQAAAESAFEEARSRYANGESDISVRRSAKVVDT